MRLNEVRIQRGPHTFGGNAVHQLRYCVLVTLVGVSACGQASPQGLDDLEAKPGTGGTRIRPYNPTLLPQETVQFRLRDETGAPVEGPIQWSATGGSVSRTGLYTAGDKLGLYSITAKHRNWTTSQKLTIAAASPSSTPEEPTSEPDSEPDSESDSPDSPPTSSPSAVLLLDDFERGDFLVWSESARVGDPYWNGTGSGGAHIGDGYISSERARTGKLAWKARIDPTISSFGRADKSQLENWRSTRNVSDFYVSAWYFIPTDYPSVSSLIMQIKAGGSGSSHKPVGVRITRDRKLILRSGILDKTINNTGVSVPVGRWFNLKARFVIADSGLVELWLDDQKIASVRTDTKDNDYAYPGVGNYIDASDYPVTCHIFIDDVKVMF